MARLMWICGILLFAAGVASAVLLLVSKEPPAGLGIDTAAILLVGGILSLGLGGVIDALRTHAVPGVSAAVPAAETAASADIPEFGPRGARAATVSAEPAEPEEVVAEVAEAEVAEVPVEPAPEEISRPTRETISALELARQKIEQALDTRKSRQQQQTPRQDAPAAADVPAEVDVVEETVTEEAVVDDGQLYVVEERVIRRHPARILSDGTVEAETSEGWMRFENLEHLDEYLDAMEQAQG